MSEKCDEKVVDKKTGLLRPCKNSVRCCKHSSESKLERKSSSGGGGERRTPVSPKRGGVRSPAGAKSHSSPVKSGRGEHGEGGGFETLPSDVQELVLAGLSASEAERVVEESSTGAATVKSRTAKCA